MGTIGKLKYRMVKKLIEDKFKHLKFRLPNIKTLAMLKMEKNFIAYCEKGYPRQPYDDAKQPIHFLIYRIGEELQELKSVYLEDLTKHKPPLSKEAILNLQEECADISNLVDYLFEKLTQKADFKSGKRE